MSFHLPGAARCRWFLALAAVAASSAVADEWTAERWRAWSEEGVDAWNAGLRAVIAVDPTSRQQATALDHEREVGELRGPLHGIPVLIKDNVETRDQPTTAGSLALAGNRTGRDAPLIENLRRSGLLIFGKANLSEWANFRSERSSSGWSAVGGQGLNPYDTSRSPCGSSSGSAAAVAAGIVPLAVGTETNGSIICPAAVNGIVGIKPTVGLVSRRGIVPIAHSQDTAGPMAANVRDAALLLAAMTGHDAQDPGSPADPARFQVDYAEALNSEGLRGKRIGVVRSLAGFHEGVDARFDQAVADLAAGGARIVDDLAFPEAPASLEDDAYSLLLYEFKHDLNAYFATLPGPERRLRLADLIEFNLQHRDTEMKWFQQEVFLKAEQMGSLDEPAYQAVRERVGEHSRQAIDRLLVLHDLDVLVSPSNTPAWVVDLVVGDRWLGGSSSIPARAGYPHVTVPMGFVHGLPVGLSFYGTAYAETTLIEAAYAYEHATGHARPPEGYRAWRPAARAE